MKFEFTTTKSKTSKIGQKPKAITKKKKKTAQETLNKLYDQGYESNGINMQKEQHFNNDMDQNEQFEEYRQLVMEYDLIESEGGESQLLDSVLMSQKEIESGGESELSDQYEPSQQLINNSAQEVKEATETKTKKKKSKKEELLKANKKMDFKLSKDQAKNNFNTMKFVDKAKQTLSKKTLNKFIMLTELYKDRVKHNNFSVHLSIYSTNYIAQVHNIFVKDGAENLTPYFLKSQVNEINQELFQNRTVQDFEIQNENFRTTNVYKHLENSVPFVEQQNMQTLDSLCGIQDKKSNYQNRNTSNEINIDKSQIIKEISQDAQFQQILYNDNNQIQNQEYKQQQNQYNSKQQQKQEIQQQINTNNQKNNIRDEGLIQDIMMDPEFLQYQRQQLDDFQNKNDQQNISSIEDMQHDQEFQHFMNQQYLHNKRQQLMEKNDKLDQQTLNMVASQQFSTKQNQNLNNNNQINQYNNNIDFDEIENLDDNEFLQLDIEENKNSAKNNEKNEKFIYFGNEMDNYKNSELIENQEEDQYQNQENVLSLEAFYKELNENDQNKDTVKNLIKKPNKYNISLEEIINQDNTDKINRIHNKKKEINSMQIQKNDENIILYQQNFYTRKPEKTNLVYSFGYDYNIHKQIDIEDDIKECIKKGFGGVKLVKMFSYREFNPAYGNSLEKRERQAKQALMLDENLSIQEQLKTGKKTKKPKKLVSIVESVQETDETRQERKTKIVLSQLEKSKSNQYNKSYCILEMDSYQTKQKLLQDDMRLFGMKIGLNNQIKFEDADYKTSIIVKNLPYGSTIQDFVNFFNELCINQRLEHLCIACEKEEQYKKITKEYLILRLKNAKQCFDVIELLDRQKFEKNTLKINHTYGNLIPEDTYKGVLSAEEMYRMETEDNTEEIVYRENFEKIGKEFLKKKVLDHHEQINQQIKEEETEQDQFYSKKDMHSMFYSIQETGIPGQNDNIFSYDIQDDDEHEEYQLLSQEEKDWFDE